MASLQRDEITTIDHAFGLWSYILDFVIGNKRRYNRRWSYRNYIIMQDDDPHRYMIYKLIELKYLVPGRRLRHGKDDLRFFHVTDAGITAAGLDKYVRKQDRIGDYKS